MRTTVTLTEELNKLIMEQMEITGNSKTKVITDILENHFNNPKKHNERGAGRKQQYGEAHALAMKAYHMNGMSYRDIAKIYNCGIGTVSRLIKEQD